MDGFYCKIPRSRVHIFSILLTGVRADNLLSSHQMRCQCRSYGSPGDVLHSPTQRPLHINPSSRTYCIDIKKLMTYDSVMQFCMKNMVERRERERQKESS